MSEPVDLSTKTPEELVHIIQNGRPGSRRSREAILELVGRKRRLQKELIYRFGVEPVNNQDTAAEVEEINQDAPDKFAKYPVFVIGIVSVLLTLAIVLSGYITEILWILIVVPATILLMGLLYYYGYRSGVESVKTYSQFKYRKDK